MAKTNLSGQECNTNGNLPGVDNPAPAFCAVNFKLEEICLEQLGKGNKLIYSVPSLDTHVCAKTTKTLNEMAAKLENTSCYVISADLPFAQQRFSKQNKLKNITTLSLMQSKQFAEDYGVLLIDGPLKALTARAVFVLNPSNTIIYEELTDDIAGEPDFNAAIQSLN